MEPTELLPDADLQMLMSLAGWQFPTPRPGAMDVRYLVDPTGNHIAVPRMLYERPTQVAFRYFLGATRATT